jgi:hypothetical protein
MSETCEVKRIQQNSTKGALDIARQAYDQAAGDYAACLGPAAQGDSLIANSQGDIDKASKDVEILKRMESFALKQLGKEASSSGTVSTLSDLATEETTKIQAEIDELKGEIRRERRLFLDADPSAPVTVAGLYYTREPDNQVLIAFLSCFGAFLLFLGLIVILGYSPDGYTDRLTMSERIKLVGGFWIVALLVTYLCFFTFT